VLLGAITVFFAASAAVAQGEPTASPGLQRDVVFTETSPLSANLELLRRFASPIAARAALRALERSGNRIAEQPVSLADERFTLYIPAWMPPDGYGLLVFVPPWDLAILPQGWRVALDRAGVIFVSAAHSGNRENTRSRREPLALLAADNVRRRYRLDPRHIFVGGFSGGSQVAMRLALGYPDLFHGALLDAGSDEIGSAEVPLPPKELFLQFQESTRLVYVTGDNDGINLALDRSSQRSMREWCVFAVEKETPPWKGHEVIGAAVLSQALDLLLAPILPDLDRLQSCRSAIDAEMSAAFDQVEALLARHQNDAAMEALIRIDRRWGGLAAPHSLDLLLP
jgi:pimeloyl-ACP methyl ester carboxylesterase